MDKWDVARHDHSVVPTESEEINYGPATGIVVLSSSMISARSKEKTAHKDTPLSHGPLVSMSFQFWNAPVIVEIL